jgi:hypothetical protein
VLVTREIVKPFKMHSMLRINVENIWELNLLIHLKISIPSSTTPLHSNSGINLGHQVKVSTKVIIIILLIINNHL